RDRNVTGVQTCALPISRESFDANPIDHAAAERYRAGGYGVWEQGPGEDGGVVATLLPGSTSTIGKSGRRSVAWIAQLSDFQLVRSEERRVGKEGRWW